MTTPTNSRIQSRELKINSITRGIYRFTSLLKCKEITRGNASKGISLFQEIRIETRTRCNGICDFCPSSAQSETRPDTLMSEECFYKIIDELADLNYDGGIKLYMNNEPLMDKRLPAFLKYIDSKHMKPRWILVQTNGLLLTYELGCKLFENGLTWLIVNDYSSNGKASQRFIDVIQKLRSQFPEKRIEYLTRSLHDVLSNRADLSPNLPVRIQYDSACIYPFRQLNITANGDVGYCCMDVLVEKPLGNVAKQSLVDIWYSRLYEAYREDLILGKRSKHNLCRYCEFRGYGLPPKKFRRVLLLLSKLAGQLRNYQIRRFMQNN